MNTKTNKKINLETEISTIIDDTTGEIKTTSTKQTKTIKVEREPDYIKLYLFSSTLLAFQKALKGIKERDAQVLYGMLKSMQFDNTIVLDGEYIKVIAAQANVSEKTVMRMKKTFLDIQVLFPYILPDGTKSRKRYIVNPHLFGRGSWDDIKQLRALFVYEESGQTSYTFQRNESVYGEFNGKTIFSNIGEL